MQYSTIHYNTIQYSTIHIKIIQHNTCTFQFNTVNWCSNGIFKLNFTLRWWIILIMNKMKLQLYPSVITVDKTTHLAAHWQWECRSGRWGRNQMFCLPLCTREALQCSLLSGSETGTDTGKKRFKNTKGPVLYMRVFVQGRKSFRDELISVPGNFLAAICMVLGRHELVRRWSHPRPNYRDELTSWDENSI